jgi:hypothetical protein
MQRASALHRVMPRKAPWDGRLRDMHSFANAFCKKR